MTLRWTSGVFYNAEKYIRFDLLCIIYKKNLFLRKFE